MALDIEDAETERLARELAGLTGDSVTNAVTEALRARLREVAAAGDDHVRRLQRLRELSADAAARWPEGRRHQDHAEQLYDDSGLPR